MIKILEAAIAKVERLSEDQQRYSAHVLEQVAGLDQDVITLG